LSPTSYCWFCKHLFKEGQAYRLHLLDCRHPVYKKRNKKLKADTHIALKVHIDCLAKEPSQAVQPVIKGDH
jgi:hypothetical protein